MNETSYFCPQCGAALVLMRGHRVNPNEGYSLYCESKKCPVQEVYGHGNTAKAAYEVVIQRFAPRKDKKA